MALSTSAQVRILVGFLVAPATGLFLVALGNCAIYGMPVTIQPSADFSRCLEGALLFVVGGVVFAYLCAVFIGAPLFYVFFRRRWLEWWRVLLGGVSSAVLAALLIAALDAERFTATFAQFLVLSVPVALFSSLTFWLLAIYRNAL